MSPRKDVVASYFEGFRQSDHARILACLTDDVVWDLYGYATLTGRDAFDREIENPDFVGSPTLTVDRLIEEAASVVAIGSGAAVRKSGEVHRFTYCDVFTFAGDVINRVESYVVPLSNPPPGFHSVTPRIVVTDATAQVECLRAVFDATGDYVPGRPAEVRIGDSLVMVAPVGERDLFPAFLYVYVDDADRVYQRALDAGATSLEAPLDTPYGDRRAMVRDPFGNVFQIAHRIRA